MAAPTNLTIQNYSRFRARLDWDDNGSDYTVERRQLNGYQWSSWSSVATDISVNYFEEPTNTLARRKTYEYRVITRTGGSDDGTSEAVSITTPTRLLTLFSDSSTAFGANGRQSGGTSYCSQGTGQFRRTFYQRVDPDLMPDSPYLLSGKVTISANNEIETINHGQAGYFSDWGRNNTNGHFPFYPEACGQRTASGQEYYFGGSDYPFNQAPFGVGEDRVNAQVPNNTDWVFIMYGANDIAPSDEGIYDTVASVISNLYALVSYWEAQGYSKKRIMISTCPPVGNSFGLWDSVVWYHPSDLSTGTGTGTSYDITDLNAGIRSICNATNGPILIDTVTICSDDNGYNWKDQIDNPTPGEGTNSPWHILGDDNHFSGALFDEMTTLIVNTMASDTAILEVNYSVVGTNITFDAWEGATVYADFDNATPTTVRSGSFSLLGANTYLYYYASDGTNTTDTYRLALSPISSNDTPSGIYSDTENIILSATSAVDPNPTIRFRWRYD